MRSIINIGVMAIVILISAGMSAADQYEIIGTLTVQESALIHTELTIQEGGNPLNRFKMTRLVLNIPEEEIKDSILLLPTVSTTFFAFYELGGGERCNRMSIAEYFATRGYDVYGYTPRLQGIPSGTCETGMLDCSLMADWDLQMMVDDVSFIRSQIEVLHPGSKVVVGGISIGAILSIAVVNAHPADYAGVFPIEGILLSDDPEVIDLNVGYCQELEAMHNAGIYYNGIFGNIIKDISYSAETEPASATLLPFYPASLTNHQVLILTLTSPTPGPTSLLVPNFVLMNGSVEEDRLYFAAESRFFENIRSHSGYINLPVARDIDCSLAGLDRQHVVNLGNFTGSVLMIGGGRGYGAYMQDQLDAFGSSDKTLLIESDFGHVDHYMSPDHRHYIEKPILKWMKRVFKQ
jgi:pimeloyl-ACP methyl ester carboxylesterase